MGEEEEERAAISKVSAFFGNRWFSLLFEFSADICSPPGQMVPYGMCIVRAVQHIRC